MNRAIPLDYYESLIVQIENDFKNLMESFKAFKNNTTDKKLILELCHNYSFLLQDIKYIVKIKENMSEIDLPVSVRFLKDLEEIRILLGEVRDFFLKYYIEK